MGGMVLVREVTSDEWELLRDVRLAALADAPYAFGSTYAREASFTREQWRGRIDTRAVTYFAHVKECADPAGLAGVWIADADAELVSMWVRPDVRGRGIGEALVSTVADWVADRGFDTLHLWVTESNERARRLYKRCGFTPTGERKPLPSDPSLAEIRMRRPLRRARPVAAR